MARVFAASLVAAATVSGLSAQTKAPALRYTDASGCGGLFLYTWNEDRSEVLTITADRNEVSLKDGETTLDLAKAGPAVAVRVEVTPGPRPSLPFCSDENAKSSEQPTVWTAVAGKVKVALKRRPGAPFQSMSVAVEDLVLRSATGAEVKQRRDIRFSAVIGDFD